MRMRRMVWKNVLVPFYACVILCSILVSQYYHRSRCQFSMPYEHLLSTSSHKVSAPNLCLVNLYELGRKEKSLDIYSVPSFKTTKKLNPEVKVGGSWKPANCQSLQKIAIIIPFRDRMDHLKVLLHRLHPMLQKQQIDYRIYVVEQYGQDIFNKGKLMNIGFLEALEADHIDCVIFHDVDLIPETDRNLYLCDKEVRHLSSAIDEMRYQLPYEQLLGGVLALRTEHFRRINGYSNMYWGWGGEDDDIACRTGAENLTISRPPLYIGRYKMIPHQKAVKSGDSTCFLTWRSRLKWDGLNNGKDMAHKIISKESKDLFTHIIIEVGKKPPDLFKQLSQFRQESTWWTLDFYNP